MQERWITISSYDDIREANAHAELLKNNGINCKTILYEPDAVLFIEPQEHDWVYLEIFEGDFEHAAELLKLEPYTLEDFERTEGATHQSEAQSQTVDRGSDMIFWGGIVSIVVVLRLLSEMF